MRLTLRTMLCYLDDVLEPADAAELGKKIEDSDYASQIVHRIRTSMRRLRLGAPKLGGEGGYDPSTVADYLDNTLPAEKVADFERVCLDPDTEVQLAEVAACHQILTLVLGEPAEVPQSMRQRIYHLAHPDAIAARSREAELHPQGANGAATEEAAHVKSQQSEAAEATSAAAFAPPQADEVEEVEVAKRERQKPEIPAYLKEGSQRSWWPALLVLALVGVAIAGIAYAVFFGPPRQPSVAATSVDDQDPLFGEAESSDDAVDESASARPEDTGEGAAGSTPPSGERPTAEGTKPKTGAADDVADAAPSDEADDEPTSADLPVGEGDRPAAGDGEPAKEPTDDSSVAKIDPADAAPAPAAETGDAAELPLVDKVIGHYISSGEVLVVLDPKVETWSRLASRTSIKPGMQLRSLPTYRPQLLLDNAVQITFLGDGELIVDNPTEDGTPYVEMPYGRAMLATVNKAGSALAIRAGERDALLTFANADAAVALEVARFHTPGADPMGEPAHVRASLSVTSGQVKWRETGREEVTLDAGQQLTMVDDNAVAVRAMAELPAWIKLSDLSDIDRRASATLEPLLVDAGPIEVKLEELAEDPRVEVRSLAMRSLASLDRFGRILETLKDETLKSYWAQHIDQLQASLSRGAPVAAEVHAAAVRANGADGEDLYRLLWGFSPQQLEEGGAKRLVDLLKHSSLDMRVVASNLLRNITGRTQGYHPHLPEARRRIAERQWEQSLAAGEVVYAAPPAALPPRTPRERP